MSQRVLRVGVLVDTERVSKYDFDLIEWAHRHPKIEISVVVTLASKVSTTKPLLVSRILRHLSGRGLKSLMRSAGWATITSLENLKLKSSHDHRGHLGFVSLDVKAPRLNATPIKSPSGLVYRFSEADIEAIKDFDLDVLIRCGSGILRGELLRSARLGIVSFHHGDNRTNRGGPAGFWEVFNKEPATGFVIQRLTEELDGGDVLYRGSFPTQSFYLRNQANIRMRSNFFMKSLLHGVADNLQLPEPEPKLPYSCSLLREPGIRQQFIYVFKLFELAISHRFERRVFGKHFRWNVAFDYADWRNLVMWKAKTIQNPPGRFLADPFVVSKDGRDYCFVEDYDGKEERGSISVVSLNEDSLNQVKPIIKEDFHLSFPFVFEFEGTHFMVPESWQAGEIRLYECLRFPDQWEFKGVLISNISAADTIIFQRGKLWWLLTNTNSLGENEHNSELSVFYSKNPISSNWTPHSTNPVIVDASRARNGGYVFDGKDHYRVSQKHGFNKYGVEAQLMRIVEITASTYIETPAARIEPKFNGASGTHHMHSNGRITVFDFQRNERW